MFHWLCGDATRCPTIVLEAVALVASAAGGGPGMPAAVSAPASSAGGAPGIFPVASAAGGSAGGAAVQVAMAPQPPPPSSALPLGLPPSQYDFSGSEKSLPHTSPASKSSSASNSRRRVCRLTDREAGGSDGSGDGGNSSEDGDEEMGETGIAMSQLSASDPSGSQAADEQVSGDELAASNDEDKAGASLPELTDDERWALALASVDTSASTSADA